MKSNKSESKKVKKDLNDDTKVHDEEKSVDIDIVDTGDSEVVSSDNKDETIDVLNKKNSCKNVIIILLSILLTVLLIVSLLFAFGVFENDNDTYKDKDEKSDVVEDNILDDDDTGEVEVEKSGPFDFDVNDKGEEVSITDSEIVRLFNLVSADLNEYDIFKSKQTLVSDLSSDVRGKLASKLYRDKLVSLGGNVYSYNGNQYVDNEKFEINEQEVIDAYNELFGEGYYSNKEIAYCGMLCCEMKYNASSKKYVGMQNACGVIPNEYEYYQFEELIKAVKYSDRLELTVSVLYPYVGFFENEFRFYYRDYKRTDKLPLDNISYEDARSYQRSNADSLEQFSYVFKLNNGQYNYYGVYKTKD